MEPLDYTDIQKSRQMAAAKERSSRRWIGPWNDSHVPSSVGSQGEQQAGSGASGPSPSPGQQEHSLAPMWSHLLGGDSVCYAPETPWISCFLEGAICTHFREWGMGFFLILFEHIYKMLGQFPFFFFFFFYISLLLFYLDEFLQNLRDGNWTKFSKLMCGLVPVLLE